MATTEKIFGLHAIAAVLSRYPERVLNLCVLDSRDDESIRRIVSMASNMGVSIETLSRKQLDHLVGGATHQGCVADVRPSKPGDDAALAAHLDSLDAPPLLLVLDGIQDPHNLGACLRSADAAGADGVLISADRSVGITPTVRKVACGAAETLPVFAVTNLARALDAIRERGIWTYGAAGEAETSLYDQDMSGAVALVLGREGKGMRRLTREKCDYLMRIPMAGAVESLNVSVAAGVCLFEARRQRFASD